MTPPRGLSLKSRLLDSLRSAAREVRHAPDRLLHRWRRFRAQRYLRQGGVPRTAVFVCLGNINRSPYAAAAFQRTLALRSRNEVRISSAGLIGPGRPAGEVTRALARGRGLDLDHHESRLVEGQEIKAADLVVVMAPGQRRRVCRLSGRSPSRVVVLGDLDPVPIVRRTIQDPYGHSEDVFERVYDRIDRCVLELVESLVGPEPASVTKT